MTPRAEAAPPSRPPWPGSEVAFSQVREDPAVEAHALATRPGRPGGGGAHVALVCSGGDTALALLAREDVARLDVIDPAPAQLDLLELKRAAALILPRDDALALLGARGAPREERLSLYARVRGALSAEARARWDARPEEVAYGVQQVGRFEELFRELAAALREAGLDPLARPAEALAWPGWRAAFERVFERERLAATFGHAAVAYSMDRSFGEHFADVFAMALARALPDGERAPRGAPARVDPAWEGENPFLRQVLEDRYALEREADGPGALPGWLEAPAYARLAAALAERPGRLRLHRGRFTEVFPRLAAGDGYDLVQTSNISDWMPVPDLEAVVALVAGALVPGGALLMRRLNGDHDLEAVVARALEVDPGECARLRRDDRSFFYREVVIGRRPYEWGCA